ncbi:hypothetical protein D3C73_1542510 [compost metagenome]
MIREPVNICVNAQQMHCSVHRAVLSVEQPQPDEADHGDRQDIRQEEHGADQRPQPNSLINDQRQYQSQYEYSRRTQQHKIK